MDSIEDLTLLAGMQDATPQMFEQLVVRSGLSASQVLMTVDRLSRLGVVVLRKEGMDYSIALGGAS